MELREKPTGPRWRYPEDDRPTQIPLGALKVANVTNLWTAGRCISCDHEAQSSLRVIGTCLATGQAAGLAAAWYVRHGAPPGVADVRAQIETVRAGGGSIGVAVGVQRALPSLDREVRRCILDGASARRARTSTKDKGER